MGVLASFPATGQYPALLLCVSDFLAAVSVHTETISPTANFHIVCQKLAGFETKRASDNGITVFATPLLEVEVILRCWHCYSHAYYPWTRALSVDCLSWHATLSSSFGRSFSEPHTNRDPNKRFSRHAVLCPLCSASWEVPPVLRRCLCGAQQTRVAQTWKPDFIHLPRRYFGETPTFPHPHITPTLEVTGPLAAS
jgi:hypothetical protein